MTIAQAWLLCVWAVAIAIVAGGFQAVNGCGPAVHNEVTERARQWFDGVSGEADGSRVLEYRDILDRHPVSLQAGAVFPDWGYGCMSMDEQSEAAHWTPFLEYGVEYFLRTYSRPYSTQAEQLIAFMFGIASHQVSDEQWHSLSGLRDGFMRVLANSTFNNEFSRAHDVLDVGGDFAMAHMDDLRYILDRWTVPMTDVVRIYADMGFAVDKWRVGMCMARQVYAMEAVKRFGKGLFPSYASRAPMLTERMDDYYIGGLYAMATGASACWQNLIGWFDSGNFTKKCLVSDYRHGPGQDPETERHGGSSAVAILDAIWPRNEWMQGIEASIEANVVDSSGMLTIDVRRLVFPDLPHVEPPVYESGYGSGGRQHAFTVQQPEAQEEPIRGESCAELSTAFPKIKQLYSTAAYSGFGTSVVVGDFSGTGQRDVAISAPYRSTSDNKNAGVVYVVSGDSVAHPFSQQDIEDADPLILSLCSEEDATNHYPLFGASLAIVDLNADGIDDLAVGSSAYGDSPTGTVLGRVDVYLGRAGSGLASTPDYTLTAAQLLEYTDSPFSRQRIGGFLFGEDIDNDGFVDLLIGAPYHADVPYELHAGKVFGYRAKRRTGGFGGQLGRPDFVISPPERRAYEWFGFSAKAVHVSGNSSFLLVGAPGHMQTDQDMDIEHVLAGAIYAFSVDTSRPDPVFEGLTFSSMKDKTQLGSQMHVWPTGKSPLVLFGSPSEHNSGRAKSSADPTPPERGWQAGEVRVFDPARWATDGDKVDGLAGLLETLRGVQSPGHFGRALATLGEDVWIGEPLSRLRDGRVYRWRRGLAKPECFMVENSIGRAHLGHSIVGSSRDGRADLLVVAAPHDSQFTRLGGSVILASS
ncbi:hypothetical protein GGI15_002822 [Coemansia interrupta]|uniref:Phosphatidylinositol-glycan-specific phospholipase D n=1 Tax=Coemansia interrupta TaxID=1126814 RepID=A0A9W8HJH0_9FUNG|nr:hypothetical protein GGI15_002822 [Coemansia interrupta]